MGTWQGNHKREPKGGRDPARLCSRPGCKAYRTHSNRTCYTHTPIAERQRVQEYLASEVYPSLKTLVKIRDDPEALNADRIKASTAILDRAGYGPGHKLEVTRTTDLRPRVLDMLQATPPALSATAKGAVTSITTLPPDISGNTALPNRNPKAKAQPK